TFADSRREFEVVLAEDDQPQRQTDIGREDVGRRLTGVDDQSSLCGRLSGQCSEDLARPGLVLRRVAGPDLAVHQGVEAGVAQAEGHVGVPALTQILDRVAAGLHRRFLPEVQVEAALDHGIDEALFAAEEVIQRRHLHSRGIADRPQGEVLARSLGEEVGGRIEQPGACISRWGLCHNAILSCTVDTEIYSSDMTVGIMTDRTLAGKTVLIGGGGKNLGGLIARQSAAAGASVAIHYNSESSRPEAEETLAAIEAEGVKGVLLSGDLTRAQNVEKLFDDAEEALGAIDIAVNTTGQVL